MLSSLNGKVAIITGANQGLGLKISRKFINAGASVVMCARNGDLLLKARERSRARISGRACH